MRYAIFAKHLQAWPLEECCQRVAAAGFAGLDLTVRPGAYVTPDQLATEFPRAVKVIQKAGLQVPLITTGLVSADDPAAQPTMELAAQLGIHELKLHYWPCERPVTPATALDRARRALAGLAKLAEKAGVRVNIHNHSGDWVQSSAWAVDSLLGDHDPRVVGAYFDPAHYTIEGGLAGWRLAAEMLAPRTTLIAVKDGTWVAARHGASGGGGPQERRWVPVGTGNVRWAETFQILQDAKYDGWASIHGEYQGPWSFKDLSAAEVLDQCVADRKAIERLWAKR